VAEKIPPDTAVETSPSSVGVQKLAYAKSQQPLGSANIEIHIFPRKKHKNIPSPSLPSFNQQSTKIHQARFKKPNQSPGSWLVVTDGPRDDLKAPTKGRKERLRNGIAWCKKSFLQDEKRMEYYTYIP